MGTERRKVDSNRRDSSWHSWYCPWVLKTTTEAHGTMGVKQLMLMPDQNNPRSLGLEEWRSESSPKVEFSLSTGYNKQLMATPWRCPTVFTSPPSLSHQNKPELTLFSRDRVLIVNCLVMSTLTSVRKLVGLTSPFSFCSAITGTLNISTTHKEICLSFRWLKVTLYWHHNGLSIMNKKLHCLLLKTRNMDKITMKNHLETLQ